MSQRPSDLDQVAAHLAAGVGLRSDFVFMVVAGLGSVLLAFLMAVLFRAPFGPEANAVRLELQDGTIIAAQGEVETRELLERHRGRIKSSQISMNRSSSWFRMVWWSVLPMFVSLSCYVLYVEGGKSRQWFRPSFEALVYGVGAGCVLFFLGAAYERMGPIFEDPISDFVASCFPDRAPASLFLVASVFAPLGEELYFRGRLLRILEERHGRLYASGATALVFGVLHFVPTLLPIYVVFGFALVALRYKTGGLIAPILAHATNNTLSLWIGS